MKYLSCTSTKYQLFFILDKVSTILYFVIYTVLRVLSVVSKTNDQKRVPPYHMFFDLSNFYVDPCNLDLVFRCILLAVFTHERTRNFRRIYHLTAILI